MPQFRYQITRVGAAGVVGMAGLVGALALAAGALWPALHSLQAMRAQLERPGAAHPAAQPVDELDRFVAALPSRGQIPAVLGQVLEQADKSEVVLDKGQYSYSPAQSGRLARYAFEFPIKGSYPNIRQFVDNTLLAVPAAGLDKLSIERKNIGDAAVTADVRFVVYVRGE
ncbi:MAG TPA: hypothetical protein VII41_16065 [Steroidobacteraceae bacterium]